MVTKNSYSAKNIKQLDRRTHARHRIGMYLGSNSSEGITTGVREIIDNSVDEALAGHGSEITISFYADNSAEVSDYGRGLPVDKNDEGVNGVILTLGTIGSGGKFNSENYATSGGLNGVGASVMVAASSRTDVTVYRDGSRYELSFQEGLPGFFAKADDPKSKFTPDTELRVSKDTRPAAERKAHPTGTTIKFWPDTSVFLPEARFDVEDIKFRVKSTAFLVPNLKINVNDYRDPENPVVETFFFEQGLAEMVPTLSHHPLVTKPLHIATTGSFTEETTVMQSDGSMKRQEVERNVDIEAAFAWNNVESTTLKSYVNIINTKNGGTHESGLWRALSRVLINHIKDTRGFLKAKEEPPVLDDVKDGFVGVLSVKFPEPTFTGQEKSNLATPQMTSVVSKAVGDELKRWLENKKNAAQVKQVCTKIVEASRIRIAAKMQKETARKKSALETSATMPAKLVPAAGTDPNAVELMVCEGDSALGGLKQARDAQVTAIFPLRGKPLNAYDLSLGQVLKNQEWSDLIQIIGAGVGREFKIEDMNYSKVIILADGDADGSHIRALIIAGIWRLMRPLVEQGRLFVAMPPLFSITTNGRNKERHYALNEAEKDKLVAKLSKQGKKWDKVVRHKGLGEYSSDVLSEVVMDPNTRVLKQITVEDAERLESILELTMGKNAGGRRDWIVENRQLVDEDNIDA